MAQVLVLLLFVVSLSADFKVKSLNEINYQEVTKQTFEESCGASAIATLLNLDDNNITEKELLKDINTTDAISLYTLEILAKKRGYKAKSYKIDIKILQKLKYPVIARISRDPNYPHFIVIEVKKDHIVVLDSNHGKYRLSQKAFDKIWTKHILVVMPKEKKFKEIENIDINRFGYLQDLRF